MIKNRKSAGWGESMNNKIKLTKNQIELISSVAGQEAIRQYKEQQKEQTKKEKDWRLRNTKLLLENYRKLKDHCDGIEEQMEEYEHTVFILEELTLETLMKYRLKTLKMMRHFDKMLGHYAHDCESGTDEEQRRFKVIYHRYISPSRLTIQELCEMYSIEQGMVYRDTRFGIKDLSVYLFGIVAVEFPH